MCGVSVLKLPTLQHWMYKRSCGCAGAATWTAPRAEHKLQKIASLVTGGLLGHGAMPYHTIWMCNLVQKPTHPPSPKTVWPIDYNVRPPQLFHVVHQILIGHPLGQFMVALFSRLRWRSAKSNLASKHGAGHDGNVQLHGFWCTNFAVCKPRCFRLCLLLVDVTAKDTAKSRHRSHACPCHQRGHVMQHV